MKTGPMVLLMLVAIVAVGATGCSSTLVESLPVGKTTTCDAAWPGRWKAIQPDRKPGEDAWLEINADCTVLTSIDKEKTEPENHKITLVSTRMGDFLWVSDPDGKPECIGPDSSHCGMELMRYARSGDEIRLYNPDHKKIHDALASHVVPGYTEDDKADIVIAKSDPKETRSEDDADKTETMNHDSTEQQGPNEGNRLYSNQIAGNPEQIAAILEKHPEFFESTPWIILRRDNAPAQSEHK
jgi:hypothetical protein